MRATRALLATLILSSWLSLAAAQQVVVVLTCGVFQGHTCAWLTVTLSGEGFGSYQTTSTLGGAPDGNIDCRRAHHVTTGTCTYGYDINNGAPIDVNYVATADAGSRLCKLGTCQSVQQLALTLVVSRSFTDDRYSFKLLNPVTISVASVGAGSGSITSSPAGIACGKVCSIDMAPGEALTLKARPAAGSVFGGWASGPCEGKPATCTTPAAASAVTVAVFNRVASPSSSAAPTPAAPASESPPAAASPDPVLGETSVPGSAAPTPPAPLPPDQGSHGMDPTPIAVAIVIGAVVIASAIVLVFMPRRNRPPA